MNKAFVDTTILHDAVALGGKAKARKARVALAGYQDTMAPFYGLRELRAGPLSYWILAHNTLVMEPAIDDAIVKLTRITAFKPRNASGSLQAVVRAFMQVIEAINNGSIGGAGKPPTDPKRELESTLCRMIFDAWRKRRSVVKQIVQPLGCFSDSELELDGSLIRFPNNKPGCLERCACGAAIELKRCSNEVQMVVDALRPPPKKGTAEPQEKPETSNRRRALKEVLAQDSGKFPRKYCRAIGDAYFCVMAPNGAVLLTTNAVDFEPMAKVLNKTVVTP